jgi:FkbM family methyltransferase
MDCQILVRANEDVGVMILAGNFEKTDLTYILSQLKDGDVFFDVGANVGLFSLAVAKGNKAINVHAFEPIPLNATLFEASLYLNGIDSVKINRTCVGNRQGEVEFSLAVDSAYSSIYDTGRKSESRKINVPITTLDDYFESNGLKRVDIIKIDVEGAERLVLDGATKIFNNPILKPRLVLMELFDLNFTLFNTSINDIVKLMREYGYDGFVFEKCNKTNFEERHYNKIYNAFFECNNVLR